MRPAAARGAKPPEAPRPAHPARPRAAPGSRTAAARDRAVDSEDLALLVAVIDAGSLSGAGRSLGVSTAMVSRRLQAVEGRLGVRLVARTSRSLRATDEGADLCDRARRILADLGEACEAAMSDGGSLSGTVRLLAPVSFGLRQIAPAIGAFCAANPRVRVEVDLADRAADLAEGGYDLQISVGLPACDSLVTRRLLQGRRAVCAAPSYWARAGLPERPEDLRARDCILSRRGRVAQDRWRFRTEAGPQHVQVAGRLSSNSGEDTRAWALAGLGVVLKPLWEVDGDLRSGALVEVFPELVDEPADVYACYPSRSLLTRRVRSLTDFLAARPGPAA